MTHHKLIILRHGESQWNHENKFCGWIDIPLSSKGVEEATYAGELLLKNNLKPTLVYTSKLTRSIQTGELILHKIKRLWCDNIKTWRLNERHYGQFQGVDKTKVFEKYGKEKYHYYRRNFHAIPPPIASNEVDPSIDDRYDNVDIPKYQLPRGESLELVMERLIPFFQHEIINKNLIHESKTVLIVTHGSVVRSIIKFLNKVSDDDISKINVPTGIPLVFELDDKGNLIGDFYYLDEERAKKGIEKVSNEGLLKL